MKSTTRRATISIEVVLFTPHGKGLAALLRRNPDARSRERWSLPWDAPRADESLGEAALRIARAPLGVDPSWLEQSGAFGQERRHPGDANVSIAFVGLIPAGAPAVVGGDDAWFQLTELPTLAPRHKAIVEGALEAVQARMDHAPIAFRLLPATFTLSDLQQVYELLLGRRLHKASFRRALQAAWLVEPTDEWRSEGRGRPAQLFRYAPRKRRASRRGVRFELLAGG
ncbi:MAG: NUDIX hydrolase [Gemmatimonadaceae bacterium]